MKYKIQGVSAVLGVCVVFAALAFSVRAYNTLPVSESSVNLEVGESTQVEVYAPRNRHVNVVSISDAYVTYANITDETLTIYGLQEGIAWIGLSTNDGYTNSIRVTVGDGDWDDDNNNDDIEFSRDNLTIDLHETEDIDIHGNSNADFYVSRNSNPNAVGAYVSGRQLVVYGIEDGTSSVTVRDYRSGESGIVRVTVRDEDDNDQAIRLIPDDIDVRVNETDDVRISGGFSKYRIESNSNPSVADAWISSDRLYVRGARSGTANIRVSADGTNRTDTLRVTVTGGSVQGSVIYANGTLINENGTLYITYKNTKSGFATDWAFRGLGYRYENAIRTQFTSLDNTGYVIGTPITPHPWGSWVKSGNTVYFVHDSGLIPIPSHQIFLNNGGVDGHVVPANSQDFDRPILRVMDWNDSRLR